MRPALTLATLSLMAFNSLAQTAATPNVEVTFDKPEHFRDASLDSNGYQRGADAYVMKELSAYLVKLGQRYLPAGQTLRIDIRDIDLAGRYEPWNSYAYDVRFMREITWPTIELNYTLSQPGKPDQQAQERVSDKMYLSRPGRQVSSSDRLFAEKAMLDDWFRQRFAPKPTS